MCGHSHEHLRRAGQERDSSCEGSWPGKYGGQQSRWQSRDVCNDYYVAMHVGQAEIAALESVGELLVMYA